MQGWFCINLGKPCSDRLSDLLGLNGYETRKYMKTNILILLTTTMLTGCGWFDRLAAAATGYSRQCIDGVEYLQFTSGATVAYTSDGKVKVCRS